MISCSCLFVLQEYEQSQFLSRTLYECISREKLDMLDMYLAMYQVSAEFCMLHLYRRIWMHLEYNQWKPTVKLVQINMTQFKLSASNMIQVEQGWLRIDWFDIRCSWLPWYNSNAAVIITVNYVFELPLQLLWCVVELTMMRTAKFAERNIYC